MLWRARLSSFAVGFSCAAAWGAYTLRTDLQEGQRALLEQARTSRARGAAGAARRRGGCAAAAPWRSALAAG
jgi:hypothetical protein